MMLIFRKKTHFYILFLLLNLAGLSCVEAAFEDIEIGARATSLAGAFVSRPDDVSGMFYNPAGLKLLKRPQVFAAYERMYIGLSDESKIGDQVFAAGMPTKFGSIGLAWHTLSLAGLYDEGMIKIGYGNAIKGKLYGGISVSGLRVGYGKTNYTRINPVFDNGYSKTGMSVDAGIIYEGDILNLGLSVMNINEPDMGLKYKNKVCRKISAGISMKQRILDLNLAMVLIDGGYRIKTGMETWIYGRRLALRGGLNIGTLKYRNAAVGLGYARDSYKIDYSFTYPLSGISNTYGSHQLSFIFRWGKVEKEEEFTWRDLIKLAKKDKEAEEEIEKEEEQMEIPPDEIAHAQELIIRAKKDFTGGSYAVAMEKVKEAAGILKDDREANELMRKGKTIVKIAGEIKGRGRRDTLLRKSIDAYIKDNGRVSLESIRYASQLYPDSELVGKVLPVIKAEFPKIAREEKVVPGIDIVTQKLQRALEMIYAQKFVDAVGLCTEILDLEPRNVLALKRMGSAYWAMGHTEKARNVWRKAIKLAPDDEQLIDFLKLKKKKAKRAERKIERKKEKPASKKADEKVRKEYENGINYYKRIKKYGAGKSTLESVLRRMIDKFKDTGIDMDYLNKEIRRYE